MRESHKKKPFQKDFPTRVFLYICIILTCLLALSMLFLHIFKLEFTDFFPYDCVVRHYLGIYCPGCGFTRALTALSHGQLLTSLCYHPLVVCALSLDIIMLASHGACRLSSGRIRGMRFHMYWLYLLLAITLLQWIIKNVFLFLGTALI